MKKVLLWCRDLDNLIGYHHSIPWHISSDLKRFKNITKNGWILVGRKTYESFPNQTLPNRKIIILTKYANYKVSDTDNHFIIQDLKQIQKMHDIDVLYIAGGAKIYKEVMEDDFLKPDYIIDSIYQKKNPDLHNDGIFIHEKTREILKQYYQANYINELDFVKTYLCYKNNSEKSSFYNQLKTKIEEIVS